MFAAVAFPDTPHLTVRNTPHPDDRLRALWRPVSTGPLLRDGHLIQITRKAFRSRARQTWPEKFFSSETARPPPVFSARESIARALPPALPHCSEKDSTESFHRAGPARAEPPASYRGDPWPLYENFPAQGPNQRPDTRRHRPQ